MTSNTCHALSTGLRCQNCMPIIIMTRYSFDAASLRDYFPFGIVKDDSQEKKYNEKIKCKEAKHTQKWLNSSMQMNVCKNGTAMINTTLQIKYIS